MKLERTLVKGPRSGQARRNRGRWVTKEEDKILREIRWFYDQPFFRDQLDPEWGPLTVRPDGYGVAVQAPKARTVLVPPSSFENLLATAPTFRCAEKAKYAALGYPVDDLKDLIRAREMERAQNDAYEAIKRRAQARSALPFEIRVKTDKVHYEQNKAVYERKGYRITCPEELIAAAHEEMRKLRVKNGFADEVPVEGEASFEKSEAERSRPVAGSRGLTRKHRAAIRCCCAVLDAYETRLGFFTATLTPLQCERLGAMEKGWNRGVAEFRRELVRVAKARGLPPLMVDVTEIQLKRMVETGVPAPHLHMALVVRNGRKKADKWLISPIEIHEIWNKCINRVAGITGDHAGRTECAGVEFDVSGYLAKYLSKGADVSTIDWEQYPGLRPSRWWNRSEEMKKAVEARTSVKPGNMVRWMWLNRRVLQEMQLITFINRRAPMDLPVGELFEVKFASARAQRDVDWLYRRDVHRQALRLWPGSEIVDGHGDKRLPVSLSIPSRDFEADGFATIPTSHAGCFTESVREALEFSFRNRQIPEPVFLGAGVFRKERGVQLKLL